MPMQDKGKPQVTVSSDMMEAFIYLPVPDTENYTLEDIHTLLKDKQIVYGINEDRLNEIVIRKEYGRNHKIAQGKRPIDGVDGFYEYNFKSNFDRHPKLRSDGTVDYWSMNLIETVMQGQVIAIYNPAIQGEEGTTVKGAVVQGKRGKELAPLKGKGFSRENDNLTYVSNMDGKIEFQNDRIIILPIYEIYGNVDISVGNIDFLGDVVIHGNVGSGVTIKTNGSITVDGVVEMATLSAGKDIILRSGMMGGSKGNIFSKKNIFAKFFEYTKIEALGYIEADVFFNCDVFSHEHIFLNGNRGSIVGGKVYAVNGVKAGDIGNDAGISTNVVVGVGRKTQKEFDTLIKKIDEMEQHLKKLEEVLRAYEKLEMEKGVSYKTDPKRMQVLRERIKDSATIAADRVEAEKLETMINGSKDASICVINQIYPGVLVQIGDLRHTVFECQKNVEFIKQLDNIHMIRLDEKVIS